MDYGKFLKHSYRWVSVQFRFQLEAVITMTTTVEYLQVLKAYWCPCNNAVICTRRLQFKSSLITNSDALVGHCLDWLYH